MNATIERNAFLESELDEKESLKVSVQRLKVTIIVNILHLMALVQFFARPRDFHYIIPILFL